MTADQLRNVYIAISIFKGIARLFNDLLILFARLSCASWVSFMLTDLLCLFLDWQKIFIRRLKVSRLATRLDLHYILIALILLLRILLRLLLIIRGLRKRRSESNF